MADCGLATRFVEHSRVNSVSKGTLRGVHFQPFTEVKLVSCVRGAVFDVVVDSVANSPPSPPATAGCHVGKGQDVARKLAH
jgi:dTDP-4-dehydrorhamnose 3,5-epimerase